jgi:hypothetical protein
MPTPSAFKTLSEIATGVVLGSSVFATGSSANPTLTIAALTLRTAAENVKRL